MDKQLQNESAEIVRHVTKYVHEGDYVVAVDVDRIEGDIGWGPSFSLADARKLDDARTALKKGDLRAAEMFGKVYRLTPLSA